MIEVALEQHNTSVANKYIPEAFDKASIYSEEGHIL